MVGHAGAVSTQELLAEIDAAVAFLVGQPGLLDVVLAEHVADAGGMCAACPGPQSGRRRWPCTVRLIAARAVRVRAAAHDRADRPTSAEPENAS
ncbi:hypothetical protein GCM10009613_54730 [Pseudonocardia kongjuensis]|uniref:Uncharacterized protein n=1 Tax=Pseudonocardia kongjuensis TaxID=102227 RepID=A0ABP4IYX9_9PSEU